MSRGERITHETKTDVIIEGLLSNMRGENVIWDFECARITIPEEEAEKQALGNWFRHPAEPVPCTATRTNRLRATGATRLSSYRDRVRSGSHDIGLHGPQQQ